MYVNDGDVITTDTVPQQILEMNFDGYISRSLRLQTVKSLKEPNSYSSDEPQGTWPNSAKRLGYSYVPRPNSTPENPLIDKVVGFHQVERVQVRSIASSDSSNDFAKLQLCDNVSDGWDGHQAQKPSKGAIITARSFLLASHSLSLRPSRVKPSVVGGIGITFRKNERKVFVEFYNNGTVHGLYSDSRTEPQTESIAPTTHHFRILIRKIRGFLDA